MLTAFRVRLLFVLFLSVFLLRSMHSAWIADDAYFSFRFAKNLVEGHGLVFNPGERIEGITNLLWTLVLAGGHALGADLEALSLWLGTFFALIFFLELGRYAVRRRWGTGTFLALSLSPVFLDFATSGLEGMMQVACLYAGLILYFLRRYSSAFLFFAVACAVRPDSILFIGVLSLFFLLTVRLPPGARIRALVPGFLFLCALQAGRLIYYGDFFPNTFYARSVQEAYPHQGWRYMSLFFQSVWWVPVAPFFLVVALPRLAWKRRRKYRTELLLLSLVLVWFLYILQVGGDFMFGRFFLAILPAMYLLLERVQYRLLPRCLWPAVVFIMILGQALSMDIYRGKTIPMIDGISDEARIYTRERRQELKSLALSLRPAMEIAQPLIAFGGAQAALLYYWNVPGIEAVTGLTDPIIARQPLHRRGRVGHEKGARLTYLKDRGVNLLLHMQADAAGILCSVEIKGLGIFPVLTYKESLELLQKDDRSVLRIPGDPQNCGLHF